MRYIAHKSRKDKNKKTAASICCRVRWEAGEGFPVANQANAIKFCSPIENLMSIVLLALRSALRFNEQWRCAILISYIFGLQHQQGPRYPQTIIPKLLAGPFALQCFAALVAATVCERSFRERSIVWSWATNRPFALRARYVYHTTFIVGMCSEMPKEATSYLVLRLLMMIENNC